MKKMLRHGWTFSLLMMLLLSGCNTEEGVAPKEGQSFIRLIPGEGSDNPVAITLLADGSILLVSNTLIFEEQVSSNKIRLVKMTASGDVLLEKSYPSGDENWTAKTISVNDNSILIAGNASLANDSTSLLFFKIGQELDSISSLQLRAPGEKLSMNGITAVDDNEVLFLASLIDRQGNNKLLGSLDQQDLAINWQKRDNKRSSPSTSILALDNSRLSWAVPANNYSEIVRTDTSLLQSQPILVQFSGASSVNSKSLFSQETNELLVFGEATFSTGRKLFSFNTTTGLKTIFGEEGNNTLNSSRKIDNAYLLTGDVEISLPETNTFQKDFLLIKTDDAGREIFRKSFGSTNNEELFDALMIENSIYAIGATGFGGVSTLLLMKTTDQGELLN